MVTEKEQIEFFLVKMEEFRKELLKDRNNRFKNPLFNQVFYKDKNGKSTLISVDTKLKALKEFHTK